MSSTSELSAVRARTATGPGHGEAFTDHMFSMVWSPEDQWHEQELGRLVNLSLHPATIGLHYGQIAFEGLKAHRQTDGTVALFRPYDHARRFQQSARRLCMPVVPEHTFVDAVERLVAADRSWLSDSSAHSLYLRPLMFGSDVSLKPRSSEQFRFLVMAFVAAGFFGDEVDTVAVWVSHEHTRAVTGGTGNVKIAGNYAPTFVAQSLAQQFGCQQVVWLDALEHRWVEEMSAMNLFLVRGIGDDAEVVTPQLSGSLLPGVTRDTLLRLAARLGYTPREQRISLDRWRDECAAGVITEAFACGTTAVITPIRQVRDSSGDWQIGDGTPGPVTSRLRRALVDLHHGVAPDPDGWLHRLS